MNQTVDTETHFAPAKLALNSLEPAIPSNAQVPASDSLFERFAWLYVFFREKIFRDDTDRFIHALWPNGKPQDGVRVAELGCGPGFYACGLAARFPKISVLGIDRAAQQLRCASNKAARLRLRNCQFAYDDVRHLSYATESFNVAIAARLFTVLPERQSALNEMYRVLAPGGRCLIAEPRFSLWASLPLFAMWLLASLSGTERGCCEPRKALVLSPEAFESLFDAQPWQHVKIWQDGRYQYALCEKG